MHPDFLLFRANLMLILKCFSIMGLTTSRLLRNSITLHSFVRCDGHNVENMFGDL
jgi:hypothetical protein